MYALEKLLEKNCCEKCIDRGDSDLFICFSLTAKIENDCTKGIFFSIHVLSNKLVISFGMKVVLLMGTMLPLCLKYFL